MKLPLQITFRNMQSSEDIEAMVRNKAEKLDQFFGDIMRCRVIIEARHKHHHQGNIYDVHIDITTPGKEIAISREAALNHAHEDVDVAIRDAFDSAKRQLQEHSAKIQRHVKAHEPTPHGKILELNPYEDFGIIQTPDGREIYFHRNSVLNADIDELAIGAEVRFQEEAGEQGPQASSVSVEGKHHVLA